MLPRWDTAVIIATAISEAIRAYSIAVCLGVDLRLIVKLELST
jgi:hypothetical protein